MSSLLDLPLPCGWETYYNGLKPTLLGANEQASARPGEAPLLFYNFFLTLSAVSLTNFGSMVIFASCVLHRSPVFSKFS